MTRERVAGEGGPLRGGRQQTPAIVTILSAMNDPELFGPWFGPTWDAWRSVLKAAFALHLSETEREVFRTLAEREPPRKRVRELWIIAGRRAGKDSIASLIATYAAAFSDDRDRLRPGERPVTMLLAVDRAQARVCLNYIAGFFEEIPLLRAMVIRRGGEGLELSNGSEISVHTNSFRLVRGRTLKFVVLDECAYYRDLDSANPDVETYNAVLPGLMTLPDSMLVGISSPYRKAGLLWEKYRAHFGRDDDEVLVIRAPSVALNPTLNRAEIERALERDPEAAAAEWLAEWRNDVGAFVAREVVDAAVVPSRHELPLVTGTVYFAACDPSGGSADAMTLAIAHASGDPDGGAVLDLIREVRPPFSPEAVVADFAAALKSYGLSVVTGDRYAGEWPRERFAVHGIAYQPAAKPKSSLYRELLPLLNSGRIELLDHPRLVTQLASLERRTARGGRDVIDHPAGSHDDLINSAAIALLAAAQKPQEIPMCVPYVSSGAEGRDLKDFDWESGQWVRGPVGPMNFDIPRSW